MNYAPMDSAMRVWARLASSGWQCSLVHKPFEAYEADRWVFHGVRLMEKQKIISFSCRQATPGLAVVLGESEADTRLRIYEYQEGLRG